MSKKKEIPLKQDFQNEFFKGSGLDSTKVVIYTDEFITGIFENAMLKKWTIVRKYNSCLQLLRIFIAVV